MSRNKVVNSDYSSDECEWKHFTAALLRGDTDDFCLDEPLRRMIFEEDEATEEAQRQQEMDAAERLVRMIYADLSPRQRRVWTLRAEGMKWDEIAAALDCSPRTVHYDWTKIRAVAHGHRA